MGTLLLKSSGKQNNHFQADEADTPVCESRLLLRCEWSQASERRRTTSQKPERRDVARLLKDHSKLFSHTSINNYKERELWKHARLNPSWCFWRVLILLQKDKVKVWELGRNEDVSFKCTSKAQGQATPQSLMEEMEGTRTHTWYSTKQPHWLENSHTLIGAARQHTLMWAKTKESSVSETGKQKGHWFVVVVCFVFLL